WIQMISPEHLNPLLFGEMGLLPDEAKVLRPPGIVNRNSVWFGLCGWATAMLHNSLNRRPALKADQWNCCCIPSYYLKH
uniref:Uncharacterized protein n=1 Tax=Sinocyclocheilus grahami TaxID=75366 RepID=A0A672RHC6_SINGR